MDIMPPMATADPDLAAQAEGYRGLRCPLEEDGGDAGAPWARPAARVAT